MILEGGTLLTVKPVEIMETRYRWFKIGTPSGVNLQNLLIAHPLKENSSFGFTYLSGDLGELDFKFFIRTRIFVNIYDENGDSYKQSVDGIGVTRFSIIKIDDKSYVRVENPGRNISDLFNSIESLTGFGFTCKLITFQKLTPNSLRFKSHSSKLLGLKVKGVEKTSNLNVNLELGSPHGVAIKEVEILNQINYHIESLTFEYIYETVKGKMTISRNGAVKISGQLSPRILRIFETDTMRKYAN